MRHSLSVALCLALVSLFGSAWADSSATRYDPGRYPAVLAEAGGVKLTEGDVRGHLALYEILVLEEATKADADAIQRDAITRFNAQPGPVAADFDELHATLEQLSAVTRPEHILAVRLQMLAAFHKAWKALPKAERPALLTRVFERVGVEATDPDKGTLLTRVDLDGFLSWMNRMSELTTGEGIGKRDMKKARKAIAKGFASLAAEQQGVIASGALLDAYYKALIAKLTPEQKRQIRQQAQAQAAAAQPAPAPAGPSQPGQAIDPGVYKIMSDMSLQSHVTSMNIIENIGGSGNYWEVVDRPW